MHRFAFILLYILLTVNTHAQNTISGKAYDGHSHELLPGVNIIVEGTSIGTSSDLEGRFTLKEIPRRLVFSF